MPDYGKRTGRDLVESLERRLAATERELRRQRGGGLSTFDRGDTITQPAPVEGQTMIQYDTDDAWYFANGEWRNFCCLPSTGPGAYDAVILGTDNLIAYYRLGEDSGDVFADSSGGGNPLSVTSQPPNDYPLTRNVTGALAANDDGAVEFNIPPGTTVAQAYGEWIEDPNTSFGPNMTPMSACGWIKAKASSLTMNDGVAFGPAGMTAFELIGWGFCVSWPARTLRFMRHADSPSGVSIPFGPSLLADTWYFVCFTDDGVNHRFYVDAVEVGSVPFPAPGSLPQADVMRIGWGIRGGGSYQWRPFFGAVDEVAIWDRALTQSEVETIYAAGVQDFGTDDILIVGEDGTATWGQVQTGSIADGAVTSAKIAPSATDGHVLKTVGGAVVWALPSVRVNY